MKLLFICVVSCSSFRAIIGDIAQAKHNLLECISSEYKRDVQSVGYTSLECTSPENIVSHEKCWGVEYSDKMPNKVKCSTCPQAYMVLDGEYCVGRTMRRPIKNATRPCDCAVNEEFIGNACYSPCSPGAVGSAQYCYPPGITDYSKYEH
mmetsp:Transcript_6146/g.9607  ORF Transcript_6146/g.9607 Transcript_6146/m.9607 type:complete len:150 (+) Transcript_6146:404-853(+)